MAQALPANLPATNSPRQVVAEFLRRIQANHEKKGDAEAVWALTTHSSDAAWGFEETKHAGRIRPAHQLGNAGQTIVLSEPFRDDAGRRRIFLRCS